MPRYDSAVLNGTVVFPFVGAVRCDVGIRDGRIAALADSIASADADTVIDARDKLVLPGGVDSHFHIGIYRDLAADASSETASALTGGVTTVLSYFRTGQNYLNKSGPYRTIFPEVVAATTGHAYTDFGYHIGVMTTEQLDEVDWLVGAQGVASFKYYMFYKGLNLTSDSTRGSAYTMAETYDLGRRCRGSAVPPCFTRTCSPRDTWGGSCHSHESPSWRAPIPREPSGSTRAKAPSLSAATPTWSCSIRAASRSSRPRFSARHRTSLRSPACACVAGRATRS